MMFCLHSLRYGGMIVQMPKILPHAGEVRSTSGGGKLEVFLQRAGLACGRFSMKPGVRLSTRFHQHPGDEIYYVVEGTCWCDLPDQDKVERIEKGMGFLIPAGTRHCAQNVDGTVETTVFFVCLNWP